MTEPLQFVAAIVGLATVAETVVTKGYRYLRAVKNCPEEVRTLMAEVNVLCGILNRLAILLGGTRQRKSGKLGHRGYNGQNGKWQLDSVTMHQSRPIEPLSCR